MTINMNEIISNVKLSKVCSIKADKDSDESKNINLVVKFDGAVLSSVFDKAVSGAVIAWQNGVGRKNFDTYKNNQTVEIQFTAPASRVPLNPILQKIYEVVNKLMPNATDEEKVAYLESLKPKA